MNSCIILLLVIGLTGYVNTQRGCGNCFPGTSTSICPYRKASDPIICDQFRRKYTPCTFSCVSNCNRGLRIEGCGQNCAPSSGPCTSTTTPIINQCLPDTTAPCDVLFVPPKGACDIDSQSESCLKCQPLSPAMGMCDSGTVTCTLNTVAPCNVQFVAPINACAQNKTSIECTKCRSTSMAKGGCI